jgi:putative ABC transport system ATP-binding protein
VTIKPDPVPSAEFVDVTYAYQRGEPVLKGVTWTAPETQGLVILRGSSGAGKSTILALISGILSPDSGTVTTLGLSLAGGDEAARALRRDRIGHVFQDFRLLDELTAVENVALPLWLQGRERKEARRLAVAALERVGIGWAERRLPASLSGGEQQRVGIARALVPGPALILADEPTTNLDDASASVVGDLLRAASRQGAAVIVASHDARLADPHDAVYTVAAGTIRPADTGFSL